MNENQKLDLKSFMDYLKENLATISLYMSSIGSCIYFILLFFLEYQYNLLPKSK